MIQRQIVMTRMKIPFVVAVIVVAVAVEAETAVAVLLVFYDSGGLGHF